MDNLNNILIKLPGEIGKKIESLPDNVLSSMEEIRIKTGKPIYILSRGIEYKIESDSGKGIEKEMLQTIFSSILSYSVYAYQEELANGYVTIEGGHRVGICGRAVVENQKIKTIKDISSINIRRSREIIGVSDPCMRFVLKNKQELFNTIIVSPPKCGKTTLLRDMIRNISHVGLKVGLCDERSEISGTYNGKAHFNLGSRTDVLDGCPKEQGMMMLIRSMSPDVIATDEIGKKEDVQGLEAALCAGIHILTTIHGTHYEDLLNSGIGSLVEENMFQRIIYLSNRPATGSILSIRDGKNNQIF
ncbi:MAG: stage III sporulation protein AA [Lachnospiraceae bacterium]